MRIGIFDCPAGAAGDMILGAIIDCGVSKEFITDSLMSLGINELAAIKINQTVKNGIRAIKFEPVIQTPHHHHNEYEHVHENASSGGHQHCHRHLSDIVKLIENAELPEKVKADSKAVFRLIAEAEAKVHCSAPEEVHFHEVGAVDSIVDIVGCCLGLNLLKVEKFYCPKITTGFGTVNCQHGTMPVPAPATEILIEGMNITRGSIETELLTPTGAAILKHFCQPQHAPEFRQICSGYGAGTKDFDKLANIVRITIGQIGQENQELVEQAVMIETNIDDTTGELVGDITLDLGNHIGCLDVWTEPVYMKKNRPAVKLCVLCDTGQKDKISEMILKSGLTLGVRQYNVNRTILDRKFETIDIKGVKVNIKKGFLNGEIVFSKPEYEDCLKLAKTIEVSTSQALNLANGIQK